MSDKLTALADGDRFQTIAFGQPPKLPQRKKAARDNRSAEAVGWQNLWDFLVYCNCFDICAVDECENVEQAAKDYELLADTLEQTSRRRSAPRHSQLNVIERPLFCLQNMGPYFAKSEGPYFAKSKGPIL